MAGTPLSNPTPGPSPNSGRGAVPPISGGPQGGSGTVPPRAPAPSQIVADVTAMVCQALTASVRQACRLARDPAALLTPGQRGELGTALRAAIDVAELAIHHLAEAAAEREGQDG